MSLKEPETEEQKSMRAIPICLLVMVLFGAPSLWAGDGWDNTSRDAVLKADWYTVDFQSDPASQIRSIRDQTGQEMHQWDVTLRTDEHGRVTSMTDPLERTHLQWDDAGRLKSATSDSGSKVLVHWDSETNKPRSLTTSWGYVEFDDQGRPQDLYTIEGQRWPATWKADGQLEQIMTPLLGAIHLRSETPNQPVAIQFPDGLSTALDWEKRDLVRTRDMQLAQRDLESTRFREPPRPLSSMRLDEERSWQYRFEMPQLLADHFAATHSGRFWSRVQELVEQSARLPMPSEQEMQRHEDYWTKGEYWTKDPYYTELARPMPEFSAESYFKAFVLTTGVIASDWARFTLQIVPGPKIDPAIDFLIKPLVEQIPVPAHNSLMQQLKAVDPNGDITRGLDVASKRLYMVGELVGNLRFIHTFLQHSLSMEPWGEAKNYDPNTGRSLLVLTGRTPWTITTQSSVSRFTKYTSGYTVSVTPLRALETTLEKVAEKTFGMALDTGLEAPMPGKTPGAPSRNVSSSPAAFQVLSLRVDQATGKVTQMQEMTLRPFNKQNDPARRTPSFMPRRGTCGEGLDCPPPGNRSVPFSSPPPPPPPPPSVFSDRLEHHGFGSSRASVGLPERPPSLTSPSLASMSGLVGRDMDRPVSAGARSYRLPSSQRPEPEVKGVLMPAQVVKNQPADMSGLFGGTTPSTPPVAPPRTQMVSSQPDGLFTPFLLFCAVEEAQ